MWQYEKMLCGYAKSLNEKSQVQNRIATSVQKEAHERPEGGVSTSDT